MTKLKKYICRIFIFVIFFVTVYCGLSKAAQIILEDNTLNLCVKSYNHTTGLDENAIITEFQENYGYKYDKLTQPLRIKTKISVKAKEKGYLVSLGKKEILGNLSNKESAWDSTFSEEEVKNFFGYDNSVGTELKDGASWDVVIQANVVMQESIPLDPTNFIFRVSAKTLWSGIDARGMTDDAPSGAQDVDIDQNSMSEDVGDAVEEAIEFGSSFVSDTINNIISVLLDFVKTLLGDVPQMLANLLQTGLRDEETGRTNLRIDFKPEDLKNRTSDNVSNPNAYIKFAEGKTEKADWQKEITIPKGVKINQAKKKKKGVDEEQLEKEKAYEFTSSTQIPLISVDFYTLAANKVEITNANFLDTSGIKNKTWKFIRNFIASIVHVMMYLTAAIILLAIIWNGILIVKDSFSSNSAKEKQKHNEMTMKLGKAIIMLIGTLVFEAICIYGSGLFLNQVGEIGGETFEGPIRVYVEKPVNYSFSTTPTGYVRYMADISNKNLNKEKAIYVGIYILLAWANLILLVLMMIRMLLMMLLAVVGFAIIIIFIFENNGTGMYKYISWAKIYLKFALIQVVIGIAFKILMEVAIN